MSDHLNASNAAHGAGIDNAASVSTPMENQKPLDADPVARMRQLEQNLAEMDRQMHARHAAHAATMAPSASGSESKIGARRDGNFKAISSAPSFNWTPLGAAMVALPYTTTSDLAGSLGVASSVRFNGQPAYTMGSYQPSGKGDEAGSGGGVRSGTVNGAVRPTSASATVKAEGKRVVREGDTNTMNGGNNTGTYVIAVRPANAAPKDARTVSNPPIKLETPEEKSAFGRWLDHVEERLRQARKHPFEALKGAGKGVINILPNLAEALAKGSAEQQAMELDEAASLQQVLGRPHVARAFSEGAAASRKAGNEVAVPKMAMSNPAQEGGDLVATGLQLFAGGVGLLRAGLKSIAGTAAASEVAKNIDTAANVLKSAPEIFYNASDGVRITNRAKTEIQKSAMAGSRPITNPGFPGAGRVDNCVNCAIATDLTFSGRPTSALPQFDSRGMSIAKIPGALNLKTNFTQAETLEEVKSIFSKFGPNSRGIVFGNRGSSMVGHVFNVVVDQRGAVKFWDGQSMTQPVIDGEKYKNFMWIRSN